MRAILDGDRPAAREARIAEYERRVQERGFIWANKQARSLTWLEEVAGEDV